MDADAIELALDELRPALGADGFSLSLGSIRGGTTAEIILEANAGACADCLVPEPMIVQLLIDALKRNGAGESTEVELTKRGFDVIE